MSVLSRLSLGHSGHSLSGHTLAFIKPCALAGLTSCPAIIYELQQLSAAGTALAELAAETALAALAELAAGTALAALAELAAGSA